MRISFVVILLMLPMYCMAAPYAVVDSRGVVINIIEWDGTTPYNPGTGMTLVEADGKTAIGGTYNAIADVFTPPTLPKNNHSTR